MPHPNMTAVLKANKPCAFDLAGRVLSAGIGAKSVVAHADDKRWCANFIEWGRPQAFAQNRIAAQARCTT